jgi:hypothetical protein
LPDCEVVNENRRGSLISIARECKKVMEKKEEPAKKTPVFDDAVRF